MRFSNLAPTIIFIVVVDSLYAHHTSEKGGLYLMKCSSQTVQNLPYKKLCKMKKKLLHVFSYTLKAFCYNILLYANLLAMNTCIIR